MVNTNDAVVIGVLGLAGFFILKDQLQDTVGGVADAAQGLGSGIAQASSGLGLGLSQTGEAVGGIAQEIESTVSSAASLPQTAFNEASESFGLVSDAGQSLFKRTTGFLGRGADYYESKINEWFGGDKVRPTEPDMHILPVGDITPIEITAPEVVEKDSFQSTQQQSFVSDNPFENTFTATKTGSSRSSSSRSSKKSSSKSSTKAVEKFREQAKTSSKLASNLSKLGWA